MADNGKKCSPALLLKASSLALKQVFARSDSELDQSSGYDLYAGRLGLTLLHAIRASLPLADADQSREQALLGLRGIEDEPPAETLGGLIGTGAKIYTLAVCGDALDEIDLIRAALRLGTGLDPARLESEAHLDVVHGVAGALLAVLALERIARRRGLAPIADAALSSALACGERLLETRVGSAPRGWPNAHGVVITGFAHGAAGISCALRRLASRIEGAEGGECTRSSAFIEAAKEGEEFEQGLYDASRGLWRAHASDPGEEGPTQAWCYGGPGICLARLEGLDLGGHSPGGPAAGLDGGPWPIFERALAATMAARLGETDHLCCGNLGRAWILAEAARRLAAGSASETALGLAEQAAARADALSYDVLRFYQRRKSFGVAADEEESLFKGGVGVCLAFLGLAYPGRVPCILDLSPVDMGQNDFSPVHS